jgi:hypothetical protein
MSGSSAAYIDALIDQRRFSDLTPVLRDELRISIQDRLDTFLLDRIIEALSDEDGDQLVKMLQEKKPMQELRQFGKEHITDYNAFMVDALREFQLLYVA